MKNIFFILSFLFALASCHSDFAADNNSNYIIPEPNDDLVIDNFAIDAEYILLDNEAYLSYPEQLISTTENYLLTSYNRGFIFVFDKKGNLISKIKPTGSGPMEIGKIDFFSLGENENTLLICDVSRHRISVFDIQSGEVVKEFYTGAFPPYSCTYVEGKIYFITNDFSGGRIKKIDYDSGKIEGEYVFGPASVNSLQTVNPFYNLGNRTFLGLTLTDTIYEIKDHTISEFIILGNKGHLPVDSSTYDFLRILEQSKPLPSMYEVYVAKGSQTPLFDLISIPLMDPRKEQYLWYHLGKRQIVRTLKFNFKYQRIFCRQMIRFQYFDGEFAYNYFFMEPEFYEDAKKYIEDNDDQISTNLENLLELYPEERPYENPILVKVKPNPNLSKLIFGD